MPRLNPAQPRRANETLICTVPIFPAPNDWQWVKIYLTDALLIDNGKQVDSLFCEDGGYLLDNEDFPCCLYFLSRDTWGDDLVSAVGFATSYATKAMQQLEPA